MLIIRNIKLSTISNSSITTIRAHSGLVLPVSGISSKNVAKTDGYVFSLGIHSFEESVRDIFLALGFKHGLTNKAKLRGLVLCVLKVLILLKPLFSSDVYRYIQSRRVTITLPVGLAKILDIVCIPSLILDSSAFGSDITGNVEYKISFSGLIDFLYENYCKFSDPITLNNKSLLVGDEDGLREYEREQECLRDNLSRLALILQGVGYSLSVSELGKLIFELVVFLRELDSSSSAYDKILLPFTQLSTYFIDIRTVDYSASRINSNKLGIFKYRSTSLPKEFLILKKAFLDLNQTNSLINYLFLFITSPSFYIDGTFSSGRNPEDVVLDCSEHSFVMVLKCLFDFQSVEPVVEQPFNDSPLPAGQVGQRQNFSTLSSSSSAYIRNFVSTRRYIASRRLAIVYSESPIAISYRDVIY